MKKSRELCNTGRWPPLFKQSDKKCH